MAPLILSSLIFLVCLILIFTEKVNRTILALLGASIMIVAGKLLHFYNEEEAIRAIDLNTIGLLLGMMILVALLEPTGFFQYIAALVGKLSKGRPVRLLVLLGSATTFISLFLDNVVTVVLVVPVTILICEILGLNPLPFLLSEAILSDTGGIATMIGSPTNVIIASAAGFSFNDFLVHALPVIFITWCSALGLLIFLFRKSLFNVPTNREAIANLDPSKAIKDRKTIFYTLIMIVIAIIGFGLEEYLDTLPSIIAIFTASVALILVRPPIKEVLKLVEWDILLFFAGLFMIVGGMKGAGVFDLLADLLREAIHLPPIIFNLAVLWLTALMSAVVDNIPITIALAPILQEMAKTGMNINPLWWALAFGVGLGGTGTIIGSTTNVVVASLSEKTHTPITPKIWNKYGLPVMLLTGVVESILFIVISLLNLW